MKVEAALSFEKIRHDQDTDAHLVVTLTAPPIEAEATRSKLCIIPLIDVSPSMYESGGQKINYAKRSVDKLLDHLAPTDYCGLVQFSGSAEVVARPMKVTAENKASLKRAVASLSCGNATNIADALLKGLELGNKLDLPGDVIVRVVLFTDGQANMGPARDLAGLVKLLEANMGSCTASAFGYGADADQNLLAELAKKGSGNYAFVQNPDDALTAFGKELGGLLSTYATNLLLNISACGEHEITDVVSDVDSEEEKVGQGVRIKIPDILAEEARHIVLAVKLKTQKGNVGPRAVNVFNVKAGWDILDANSKKERKGDEAKAKVQFVKAGEESKEVPTDLAKIISLAQVVQAQLEAEELAKRGDYQGAVKHMTTAARRFGAGGQSAAAYLAGQVGIRLCSAQAYQDNGGYLRSMATGGTRAMGGASYDTSASAALASYGVSLSNSVQTSTSNAFAGDAASVAPVVGQVWPTTSLGDSSLQWGGVAPVGGGVVDSSRVFDHTFGIVSSNGVNLNLMGAQPAPAPVGVAPSPPPPPRTDSKAKAEHKAMRKDRLSRKSKSW
jgi:Ca-activated chloride channel family protein